MEKGNKVEENRLRRMADRQGLRLSKSRRRDPKALGYGLYALINVQTGGLIHQDLAGHSIHALTLEDVRDWLESDE